MEKSMISPNPNDPPIFRDISAEQQQLYIDIRNYIVFVQEQINNLRKDINNYNISHDAAHNKKLLKILKDKTAEFIGLRNQYLGFTTDDCIEKVSCLVNILLEENAKKSLQVLQKIKNDLVLWNRRINKVSFWKDNNIKTIKTFKNKLKNFQMDFSIIRSGYVGKLIVNQ